MDAVEDIGDRESRGDRDDEAATVVNQLISEGIPERLQAELHQTALASAATEIEQTALNKKAEPTGKETGIELGQEEELEAGRLKEGLESED